MPPVFSNNMVLQCDKPVPLWGMSAANERITVEFAEQKKMVTAGADGKWMLKLDPLSASAKPRTMTIFASESQTPLTFTDVLVGEVWLCSGQSNMYMPMEGISWAPNGVENSREEIVRANYPEIRLFCDPQHPEWNKKGWQRCAPQTVGPFSATAYYFGRKLYQQLDVPIGLINISRGGSPIQQWTPHEMAMQVPVIKKYSDLFAQNKTQVEQYNAEFSEYYKAVNKHDSNSAPTVSQPPKPLPEELDIARGYSGSALFDTLIDPVIPFSIRGVIWYQGEANVQTLEIAQNYDDILRALITGWRQKWQESHLPFFFVQLPGWDILPYAQHWPWSRQSMLNVCRSMPDTGMAVTVDIGEPNDLHPPRKKPVGERLAFLALAKIYGKSCIYSGPIPVEVKNEPNKLCVHFDTVGSELQINGNKWNDVEVAGADGQFYPAVATINKSDAIVSCPQVKNPTALRYGWKPYFEPTLFNKEGLPGTPFHFVCDKNGKWYLWSIGDLSSSSNLMFTQSDSWCAIGDSITHGGEYHRFVYLYYITRFPEARFDIYNCGCGGGITRQAIDRLDSDIFIHKPTVATIMFGINDIYWQNNKSIGPDDYIKDMGKLIDRLQEKNCKVVLISPPIYDNTVESGTPVLPCYNGFDDNVQKLRELAGQRNIPLVDVHDHFKRITAEQQSGNRKFSLFASDRVHPLEAGHFIIAYDILKQQAVPALVSAVEIEAKEQKIVSETRCKVESIQYADDSLTFKMLEQSLPFPITEIPAGSRPLVPFENDFNQEILKVNGLSVGKYSLYIDDSQIGDYMSEEFSKGINIALLADTPQQRQAQKVGELNLKRHRIIADKLRYIAMMEYGQLKKSYEMDDIKTAQKDIALFLKTLTGSQNLESVRKSFEPYCQYKPIQSKLIEDAQFLNEQIVVVNKPIPHVVLIRKVR
jgi:lysophospholipase L1-like esterase